MRVITSLGCCRPICSVKTSLRLNFLSSLLSFQTPVIVVFLYLFSSPFFVVIAGTWVGVLTGGWLEEGAMIAGLRIESMVSNRVLRIDNIRVK